MKRLIAAAAVLALLPVSACTSEDKEVPAWRAPAAAAAKPAVSVLPTGLVAVVRIDDHVELRAYDATNGALLRTLTAPTGGSVVFSPDYTYAAEIDHSINLLRLYALSGDAYQPSGSLSAESLQAPGLTLVSAAFIPRTDRLAVEVDGGDGGMHKTVSLNPADPGPTLGDFAGIPDRWDSYGQPVERLHVATPTIPDTKDATVSRTSRELVDGDVVARDDDGDGRSALLYSCHGRQVGPFTLACWGQGTRAELATLTADPATNEATVRVLAKAKGEPFTNVYVAPDGKRMLAERADGFYATTVAGAGPKRLFGPLAGGGNISSLNWD